MILSRIALCTVACTLLNQRDLSQEPAGWRVLRSEH